MGGSRSWVAVAVFLLFHSSFSSASPILDQATLAPVPGASWGGGFGCPCQSPGDFFDIAQTFTVGRTGILTSVDLFMDATVGLGFPESDLLFDIRPTLAGVPLTSNNSALIALQISKYSVPRVEPEFCSVDLTSAHLNVVEGEQLAIVLRAMGGNYGFGGQPYNPYASGSLYGRSVISNPMWSVNFDPYHGDIAFRTYVDEPIQEVPEPATVMLMTLGLPAWLVKRRPSKTIDHP
jgi:hypothetical protein